MARKKKPRGKRITMYTTERYTPAENENNKIHLNREKSKKKKKRRVRRDGRQTGRYRGDNNNPEKKQPTIERKNERQHTKSKKSKCRTFIL